MTSFEKLLDIVAELRQKCPWDREQTIESLRTMTIEETYELSEAILDKDMPNICKELGDVLLHVVFYALLAQEQSAFNIDDVIEALCNKLVYRHPHVFGDDTAANAGEVVQRWAQRKLTEKDGTRSVLAGVPKGLPALIKAYRIQDKVRAVGFDWEKREEVWDKVKEEIAEWEHELQHGADKGRAEDELGDILFAIVNAARLYDIDPETALEHTNKKFIQRFNFIEQQAQQQNRAIDSLSLDEMNLLWEKAKTRE
ncbi:nucleoside triphosphate pyrophosphohydrolase [Bacteroidia bacterium]|nr:nucleoside triphosphate pyrophosphohydrolase [Bacteroidia bacterium]